MNLSNQNEMEGGTDVYLTSSSMTYLKEIKGWTKFLTILGFIISALLVLGLLGAIIFLSASSESRVAMIIWFPFLAIYLIPLYYLYKFTMNIQKMLASQSAFDLEDALGSLKSHYKSIGILTIIWLVFNGAWLIFALLFGGAAMLGALS